MTICKNAEYYKMYNKNISVGASWNNVILKLNIIELVIYIIVQIIKK